MTVIWTSRAYDDLDRIAGYMAGVSHEAAERTISRIQEAVLRLSEFPDAGTKVDETRLRRLVVSQSHASSFTGSWGSMSASEAFFMRASAASSSEAGSA
jgi:plasmid stabilization system protein ParE